MLKGPNVDKPRFIQTLFTLKRELNSIKACLSTPRFLSSRAQDFSSKCLGTVISKPLNLKPDPLNKTRSSKKSIH